MSRFVLKKVDFHTLTVVDTLTGKTYGSFHRFYEKSLIDLLVLLNGEQKG